MTAQLQSLFEEFVDALNGVPRLLVADRRAAGFFDFSQRGLVGSIIALLVSLLILLGIETYEGVNQLGFTTIVVVTAIECAVQIGAAWLLLRQFGRLDSLVPYLVVDNWASLILVILQLGFTLIGIPFEVQVIVVLLMAVALLVNTARVIMTLLPGQVALFVATYVIAWMIAIVLTSPLLPPQMPESAPTTEVSRTN